ncbi:MAG: HAMP domain-containing histidine kinase [Planctomycetes bacterium]|nr:HAMP domain-containing histidine kinase [Planctomycetota bacterium]
MNVTRPRPAAIGILTSRLGRRFVLLFTGCALLPLLVFAWLAVTRVTGQMHDDLRTSLHGAAKTAGMGLAARLSQVAGDLSLVREFVERRGRTGEPVAGSILHQHLGERCAAIAVATPAGTETLVGTAGMALPQLDAVQLAHLAAGKPLLVAHGDPVRLAMLAAVEPAQPARGTIVASIRGQWFWDPEELRVAGSQFAAFDGRLQPLFQTFRRLPDAEPLRLAVRARPSSGTFAWNADGDDWVARYWRAFLQPQYGADFYVVQAQTRATAYGVAWEFTGWFLLTAAATLLLVLLVSLVQIRRTLDPIVALSAATTAVASGDLSVRVDVRTRDELGELGAAFNGMTAQLRENIERRARTERQLVESRDAALAAARAKAEFVTNVSHEFRTPMTEILSAVEILGGVAAADEGAREEFAAIALRGAQRLARMVDDVLELDGNAAYTREPVDVAVSLHAAVDELLPADRDRVQLAAVPAIVVGDAARLQQAWHRLLDNALKFSAVDQPVVVTARVVGVAVVVEFVDRGAGISRLDLDRIFEPFCQVGRDQMVDKAHGTGLGLTLVKATIERLGGRIEVDSELGAGSTFRIALPLALPVPVPATSGQG